MLYTQEQIDMTRGQQVDFERCCDFLARMFEKYADEMELPRTRPLQMLFEDSIKSADKIDYFLQIEKSRIA